MYYLTIRLYPRCVYTAHQYHNFSIVTIIDISRGSPFFIPIDSYFDLFARTTRKPRNLHTNPRGQDAKYRKNIHIYTIIHLKTIAGRLDAPPPDETRRLRGLILIGSRAPRRSIKTAFRHGCRRHAWCNHATKVKHRRHVINVAGERVVPSPRHCPRVLHISATT